MTQAVVKHSGGSIAMPGTEHSVLGESQPKIPVGGKIRGGIKVLTAAAARHPKAAEIYNAGVQAGKTFAEIERELKAQCNFDRSPLTPKNVPYFSVRRRDFVVPEVADLIMEKYGSDGPNGFHLYRFPVIFPVDNWQQVMPHALQTFTRNELVYWSQYTPDGTRLCMTHAPIAVDPKSKRAARPYGGRPIVPRAENEGLCDPHKCKEYQNGACNLTGAFIFYVPGISGSSAISLSTRSYYSMQQAREKLLQFFRGCGRISGTFDKKPIFYLTKKQEEVSMIDLESGKPKRVKQWLIVLEADIDMTRVFQMGEQRAALSGGSQPPAMLEAPNAVDALETDDDDTGDGNGAPQRTEPDQRDAIKAARKSVFDRLTAIGIDVEIFSRYAVRTWGEKWSTTLESLDRADANLKYIDENNDVEAIREIQAIGRSS